MSVGEQSNGVIALAGNPNAGKTAVFNALTGSRQRVGNWPGVTVDKRTGAYTFQNETYRVVDLPGTYSLNVASEEGSLDQRIACEYLLSREADFIVNVIDGSNLERNLYVTLQLLALRIPIILAVNMMDIVEKRGICLDLKKLSNVLGCPVVDMVASRGKGVHELRMAVADMMERPRVSDFQLPLLPAMTKAVRELSHLISESNISHISSRWLAQRLLEDDLLASSQVNDAVLLLKEDLIEQVETTTGEEPDILMADARYGAIGEIVLSVTTLLNSKRQTWTEKIDKIVLNRYLGIPIFLAVMYCMFVFAINVGGVFQDFFDISSHAIFVTGMAHGLQALHFPDVLIAILSQGAGKGINTVLSFLPVLAGMFFFLAFLEDCGYMSRAAFVMDRFMQTLGLPGKSFVPMIVGFGCNVPAVMGARGIEGKRDRIVTILMMPFMSCGARLAIFAVFASAFFPVGGEDIIFLLYLTGILVAVLTGLLLRKTLLPGKSAPLVMELPAYHQPSVVSICRQAGSRLSKFIWRAGRIIIVVCVIIGALNTMTVHGKVVHNKNGGQGSILSQVGRMATPLLAPMGIEKNNWPATVGLVTGILAKEVVIGSLNTLYGQSVGLSHTQPHQFSVLAGLKTAWKTIPDNLSHLGAALKNPLLAEAAPHYMNRSAYGVMYHRFDGKIGAFAYLLFVLLYFPCVSTMAAMCRELNKRWVMFSVWWSLTLAYAVSVIVYQAFTLNIHPLYSLLWIIGMLLYLLSVIILLRLRHRPIMYQYASAS